MSPWMTFKKACLCIYASKHTEATEQQIIWFCSRRQGQPINPQISLCYCWPLKNKNCQLWYISTHHCWARRRVLIRESSIQTVWNECCFSLQDRRWNNTELKQDFLLTTNLFPFLTDKFTWSVHLGSQDLNLYLFILVEIWVRNLSIILKKGYFVSLCWQVSIDLVINRSKDVWIPSCQCSKVLQKGPTHRRAKQTT